MLGNMTAEQWSTAANAAGMLMIVAGLIVVAEIIRLIIRLIRKPNDPPDSFCG